MEKSGLQKKMSLSDAKDMATDMKKSKSEVPATVQTLDKDELKDEAKKIKKKKEREKLVAEFEKQKSELAALRKQGEEDAKKAKETTHLLREEQIARIEEQREAKHYKDLVAQLSR